ncbi:hypothetical protein F444_08507, partial [Phytophthora nicotianae P1976]
MLTNIKRFFVPARHEPPHKCGEAEEAKGKERNHSPDPGASPRKSKCPTPVGVPQVRHSDQIPSWLPMEDVEPVPREEEPQQAVEDTLTESETQEQPSKETETTQEDQEPVNEEEKDTTTEETPETEDTEVKAAMEKPSEATEVTEKTEIEATELSEATEETGKTEIET